MFVTSTVSKEEQQRRKKEKKTKSITAGRGKQRRNPPPPQKKTETYLEIFVFEDYYYRSFSSALDMKRGKREKIFIYKKKHQKEKPITSQRFYRRSIMWVLIIFFNKICFSLSSRWVWHPPRFLNVLFPTLMRNKSTRKFEILFPFPEIVQCLESCFRKSFQTVGQPLPLILLPYVDITTGPQINHDLSSKYSFSSGILVLFCC